MPSDGGKTFAFTVSITALASGLRSLASPRVGGALLLFAAGLGSIALTYPAVSPLQGVVVGVGGWLVVRTVAPGPEPARRSAPGLATCIDCGRTVAASIDGPVRCIDCADAAAAHTTRTTRTTTRGTERTTTRRTVGARTTATGRTADAGGGAERAASASASTAAASAGAGAGSTTGSATATGTTAATESGAGGSCDRCGAAGEPLDRVRLLDGDDYDYCADCRAEAEDAGAVHTVAMSRERAYEVLGLSAGADDAAVRAAFRERAKATHPDRDGDRDRFDRVREAYERLTE